MGQYKVIEGGLGKVVIGGGSIGEDRLMGTGIMTVQVKRR